MGESKPPKTISRHCPFNPGCTCYTERIKTKTERGKEGAVIARRALVSFCKFTWNIPQKRIATMPDIWHVSAMATSLTSVQCSETVEVSRQKC
jgi:hypothetical protein